MKKVLSAFVKYPFYGKMFMLVLILLGLISLSKMKKATFPMVDSTTISISVSYPGATPQEMEEGVATLIENAIRGIPGIKEFSSKSSEDAAVVTIEALSSYDIDELLIEVKNEVDGISNFPSGAEQATVAKMRRTDIAVFMNLMSETDDLHELNDEANRIEDALLATGFISQITIYGIPDNMELVIEVDETQLQRYSLDINSITTAIYNNNTDVKGGTIRNDREEITIVSRQRSIETADIKNIVLLTNNNGKIVRVGDVANVRLTFEETPSASYIDGRICATFKIQKLMTEDLDQISTYVRDYAEVYNKSHSSTQLRISHDFLLNINSQLSTLVYSGILGVILIILMLSLLLNFRLSLWVAWGIPASFLGMFIVAVIGGITLNMISLFGMILIIGILVDDGVVIGENIFTHYEKGKSPRRSAIDGTLEVLPAVFTSVTTTIIAFVPLFFIEGELKMMYQMAFVVIAVLAISLFEALFVLPSHLANPKVLKPLNEKSVYGKVRLKTEKYIIALRDKMYLPFLNRILKNQVISLSIVTFMVIVTFGLLLSGKIAFVFFPGQPADMFTIDLALKPGINEEITREKLFWIDSLVWEVNDELVEKYGDTASYISHTEITAGMAFSGAEIGSNSGLVRVFLNSLDDVEFDEDYIKSQIALKTANIPEAYKYTVGASNRFGAPVSISLMGYDADELESAQYMLESELGKIASLYNITNNSQLGGQELRIELKPEAYLVGLDNSSIMEQIRNSYNGDLVQRIQDGKDEIWVYVRYSLANRKTVGQLENMMIQGSTGSYMLKNIANIIVDRSLNTINRFNGQREIRVDAYMRNQNESISPIFEEVQDVILPNLLAEYPNITYMIQGQQKDSGEQIDSLILYFGIAFLIIVIIIMIYFKSFNQGLLILMMIPLGIVGAIWGHGIHGKPISMMSLWGFIGLSGTIINDAIVFMSKYNQNLVKGMKLLDAILDAGKSRFRAILLTTVTTTAGLMPLILADSSDAQMLIPMAIALAYGILFGTIFILLILPVGISVTNRINLGVKKLFGNKDLEPEMVEVAVINNNIEEALKDAMGREFE